MFDTGSWGILAKHGFGFSGQKGLIKPYFLTAIPVGTWLRDRSRFPFRLYTMFWRIFGGVPGPWGRRRFWRWLQSKIEQVPWSKNSMWVMLGLWFLVLQLDKDIKGAHPCPLSFKPGTLRRGQLGRAGFQVLLACFLWDTSTSLLSLTVQIVTVCSDLARCSDDPVSALKAVHQETSLLLGFVTFYTDPKRDGSNRTLLGITPFLSHVLWAYHREHGHVHFGRSLAHLSHVCILNWGTIKSYLSSRAQANRPGPCNAWRVRLDGGQMLISLAASFLMPTSSSLMCILTAFRPGHTYERMVGNILSHLHVPFLKTPLKLRLPCVVYLSIWIDEDIDLQRCIVKMGAFIGWQLVVLGAFVSFQNGIHRCHFGSSSPFQFLSDRSVTRG